MNFGAALGPLLTSLGSAVLVTIATEVVVAGLPGLRQLRELGIVALANLATNPAVNLLVGLAMAVSGTSSLLHPAVLATAVVLEVAAVVAEWRIYRYALPDHRHRALAVAVTANAASLIVGVLMFGTGAPAV